MRKVPKNLFCMWFDDTFPGKLILFKYHKETFNPKYQHKQHIQNMRKAVPHDMGTVPLKWKSKERREQDTVVFQAEVLAVYKQGSVKNNSAWGILQAVWKRAMWN